MVLTDLQAVAFSMPGGEAAGAPQSRPIDLKHLEAQTFGDRELEAEVLGLFAQQVAAAAERIVKADHASRKSIGHMLRGSARGVGAFALAETAAAIDDDPFDETLVDRLLTDIAAVRDFIAAMTR